MLPQRVRGAVTAFLASSHRGRGLSTRRLVAVKPEATLDRVVQRVTTRTNQRALGVAQPPGRATIGEPRFYGLVVDRGLKTCVELLAFIHERLDAFPSLRSRLQGRVYRVPVLELTGNLGAQCIRRPPPKRYGSAAAAETLDHLVNPPKPSRTLQIGDTR
jgi:hypothetical protein